VKTNRHVSSLGRSWLHQCKWLRFLKPQILLRDKVPLALSHEPLLPEKLQFARWKARDEQFLQLLQTSIGSKSMDVEGCGCCYVPTVYRDVATFAMRSITNTSGAAPTRGSSIRQPSQTSSSYSSPLNSQVNNN